MENNGVKIVRLIKKKMNKETFNGLKGRKVDKWRTI